VRQLVRERLGPAAGRPHDAAHHHPAAGAGHADQLGQAAGGAVGADRHVEQAVVERQVGRLTHAQLRVRQAPPGDLQQLRRRVDTGRERTAQLGRAQQLAHAAAHVQQAQAGHPAECREDGPVQRAVLRFGQRWPLLSPRSHDPRVERC
jgi:hypothetical protein